MVARFKITTDISRYTFLWTSRLRFFSFFFEHCDFRCLTHFLFEHFSFFFEHRDFRCLTHFLFQHRDFRCLTHFFCEHRDFRFVTLFLSEHRDFRFVTHFFFEHRDFFRALHSDINHDWSFEFRGFGVLIPWLTTWINRQWWWRVFTKYALRFQYLKNLKFLLFQFPVEAICIRYC